MKTSELRKMRDFCANVDIDTPATKLAAEVIRLREGLSDMRVGIRTAIEAGDWVVDGACDPELMIRRANALLTEHDEP